MKKLINLKIAFGVTLCSLLRTLLFKYDSWSILYHIDITSYVDDNAPYIAADNIDDLIKSLEETSSALFQWFDNNLLKNNPGECHLLISSNKSKTVKIGKYETKNSECENLLGVRLDWKLILMAILLVYGKRLVEN